MVQSKSFTVHHTWFHCQPPLQPHLIVCPGRSNQHEESTRCDLPGQFCTQRQPRKSWVKKWSCTGQSANKLRLTRVGQVGQLWLAPDVWVVSSLKTYISANLGSSCLAGEPQQDGCNCNGHKNPLVNPWYHGQVFNTCHGSADEKTSSSSPCTAEIQKKNRWVEVLICVCGIKSLVLFL